MSAQTHDNPDQTPKPRVPDTMGGALTSALNIEDEISSGVYDEYMDRRHWPEQLDDETFNEIKKRLTVLIEDTKKHRKIVEALVREHGQTQ